MLKRSPPCRSKEAGTREGRGRSPTSPRTPGRPIPRRGAGSQVKTGTQHRPQALRPKKKKTHLFLGHAGGHHTALRLPQLFLNVIEITESCFHELIFK